MAKKIEKQVLDEKYRHLLLKGQHLKSVAKELILEREVSTPKVNSQRLESEKMKCRHLIQEVSTPAVSSQTS